MFQGNFFFLQGKRLKLIMFRIVSKTERKKTSLSRCGSRDDGRTDTCVHEYFCDVCGSVRAGSKAIGFLEWIWSVSKNRLYLRRRIRAWPKASVNQWHSYFSCNSRSAHFAEVRSKKGITGTEGDDCCLIFFSRNKTVVRFSLKTRHTKQNKAKR